MYIDPRNKLFGHLDRLADIKAGKRPAPVNVEVDLSNRCNLGCAWCHFSHVHSRGPWSDKTNLDTGDLMDMNLALRMVTELTSFGVRSISWTGGGEPLMNPHATEIFKRTEIDQGLYTNGVMITPEIADILQRTMEWVYISLDCADAESYHRMKGFGFDKATNAVKMLAGGDATIGVGFLLNKANWRQMWEMADLGLGLGADYVQFRPAVIFDGNKLGEDTSWMVECISWLNDLKEQRGIEIDTQRFVEYKNWTEHGYDVCWWSALQCVITPDGRVWGCVNKRGIELLGDLNTESFKKIWKRSDIQCVNRDCRAFCRGHIPNTVLNNLMSTIKAHRNFI